jgi:hypothetical protein
VRLRKRIIITGIIITGIMAVAAPTGIIIGPLGRGEVPTRSQLVERRALFPDLVPPILFCLALHRFRNSSGSLAIIRRNPPAPNRG